VPLIFSPSLSLKGSTLAVDEVRVGPGLLELDALRVLKVAETPTGWPAKKLLAGAGGQIELDLVGLVARRARNLHDGFLVGGA